MSTACLAFLFAAAVTLHNLEEAFFLPRWLRAHRRIRFDPNPTAYWVGTTLASILVWIAALGAVLRPAVPAFHFALAGSALGVAINAVLPHLAESLIQRSYMPGTATGILFNLPLAVFLLRVQLGAGPASPASFWLQAMLYAALLGIAVFGSLYALHALFRRAPFAGNSGDSAGPLNG
ncbi:MAG: HXXEE domain-containing protein [Terracidiphilus sp.]